MPGTLPEPTDPPESIREAIRSAPDTGHGYVVLHHALASWAHWDEWAEFVGGRYLYQPGVVRGVTCPGDRVEMTGNDPQQRHHAHVPPVLVPPGSGPHPHGG